MEGLQFDGADADPEVAFGEGGVRAVVAEVVVDLLHELEGDDESVAEVELIFIFRPLTFFGSEDFAAGEAKLKQLLQVLAVVWVNLTVLAYLR